MKSFVLTTLLVLASGGAARADEPLPTTPAAGTVSAPAAGSSDAGSTAALKAAQQQSDLEKQERDRAARTANAIKQLRAQGYKPVKQKNGDTLYCRNEAPLGSRLEQTRCSSLASILETTDKSQELVEQLRRNNLTNPNVIAIN